MGTRTALHPTDLMNPKHHRSAEAMMASSHRLHHLAVAEFGPSVDGKLEADIRLWYDAWLLLSVGRMLRFRRAVDFRVFLRGVRVQLGRGWTAISFNATADKFRNYVATSQPYRFKQYAIMFRPTDTMRVVEVEYVW